MQPIVDAPTEAFAEKLAVWARYLSGDERLLLLHTLERAAGEAAQDVSGHDASALTPERIKALVLRIAGFEELPSPVP